MIWYFKVKTFFIYANFLRDFFWAGLRYYMASPVASHTCTVGALGGSVNHKAHKVLPPGVQCFFVVFVVFLCVLCGL